MNISRFTLHFLLNPLPLLLLFLAWSSVRQARADSMTVSETWRDNSITSSSDSGTFSASLTIPGLQNFTTATWSNLTISILAPNLTLGGFNDTLGNVNTNNYGPGSSFSSTSATVVYQMTDTNGNPVNAFKLTFSRSGNILTISGQTQSPASLQPPWSIVAENYLFSNGATNDPDPCEVVLQTNGVAYADIMRTIPITAVNTITLDGQGNPLNNITAGGSADFTPPTITDVSPAGSPLTVTNGLLNFTVRATDASGVSNVEVYVNGQDFGPGVAGVSNLWSQNLALLPGINTVQAVAMDKQSNLSTNSLTITYANGLTNTSLINLSEHWLDSYVTNSGGVGALTQDAGVLDAALPVPALQTMSATTWSNLVLTVNFGGIQFTQSLTAANVLTTNSATFQIFTNDPSDNPVLAEQLAVTRAGGKLLLAAEVVNPTYALPMPVIANLYSNLAGVINDQQPFTLAVVDGMTSAQYFNLTRTIYLAGTNTLKVTNSVTLNNIQLTGAADFTSPSLTNVAPATATLTITNGLLQVAVRATDNIAVTNVEFSVNGQDFGPGMPAVSNLWSQNLALVPGTNVIVTTAMDPSGNVSTNNRLTVTYANGQTNANLITFSEHWLDSYIPDNEGGNSHAQDAGVLNAALTVPALQTMTATTWSNLELSVGFGNFQFTSNLMTATSLTSTSATFQILPVTDAADVPATVQQLTITRVGTKLLLAADSVNPTYAPVAPIIANNYYSFHSSGAINDQRTFTLTLTDGNNTSVQYANTNRIIYIIGTNSVTVTNTITLDNIQISGAADFIPPTNQITAPIAGQQWSNNTFVVTGKARDDRAVSNVVYTLNGSDWLQATTGNQWTNWTAPINLVPGTNTIMAYAYDYDNNDSVTSTVSFRYIPSSTIALSTNGLGTLSPNYAGAMLGISNIYSITATPASGFIFSNWSGSTNVKTATLTFQMQSNLAFTVSFIDVTRPTLSITNLTAGQQLSNFAFTVRGNAADNWQVTNVVYQLNNGGWNQAMTGNTWTNWNVPLTLVPGTNTIQVYAQDEGGNNSLTNTLTFAYIVSSRLQIQLNGLGTISPNYSNALLAIGQNYSVTATPATGFIFTNWVVSTNWIGGRTVNSATLPFMMASNLTLLGNLVEVTRPLVTITAPTANQRMTNALAAVTGTASDNWKVTGVWYQFNTGPWTIAPTTNNWTNWNTTLTLPAGTNSLNAYALDLGGNYSLTSTVSFFSSNTFQLQFAFATNTPLAANGLNFDLLVSTNLRGHVQYSTNLLNWITLTNFNGTNSTLKFIDSSATNGGPRFYRAVIP